jgi:hypothetical protein
MSEKKPNLITIDNVEHDFNEMTQEQQTLVNHVADLDRKINSTQFNLDQLKVGQQAFIQLLKESLEKEPETAQ